MGNVLILWLFLRWTRLKYFWDSQIRRSIQKFERFLSIYICTYIHRASYIINIFGNGYSFPILYIRNSILFRFNSLAITTCFSNTYKTTLTLV